MLNAFTPRYSKFPELFQQPRPYKHKHFGNFEPYYLTVLSKLLIKPEITSLVP